MGDKKKTMEEVPPTRGGGFRGRGAPRGRGSFEGRGGRGVIRGRGGMDSRGRGGMMRGRGGERGGFGGPPRGRGAPGDRGSGGRFQRRGVGGMNSRGSGDYSSRQEGGRGRFQRGGRGGDRGGSRPMDRSSYGPGSGPRPKRGRFDSSQPGGANGYNHQQGQYPGYDTQATNYSAASSSVSYGSRDGYSSTTGADTRYTDQGYGQPNTYEQPRHSDVYDTTSNPYAQSGGVGGGYAANVSSASGAYDAVDYQNYTAPQTADTRGYVPQQTTPYPSQDVYSTAYSKTVPPPQARGGEAYGSGGAGYSSNPTASYDDRGYPTTYDSPNYGGYGKTDYGSNYGQRRY